VAVPFAVMFTTHSQISDRLHATQGSAVVTHTRTRTRTRTLMRLHRRTQKDVQGAVHLEHVKFLRLLLHFFSFVFLFVIYFFNRGSFNGAVSRSDCIASYGMINN
jgi:hypothetical protein